MASTAQTSHEGFSLYTSQDSYTLQPTGDGQQVRSLTIGRNPCHIKLNAPGTPLPSTNEMPKPVFGLMGMISLATTEYLIFITSAKIQGKLQGHPIYLASHFLILPVSTSPLENATEKHLLGLLHQHLMAGKFWFSYEWDLTRRLQAQAADVASSQGKYMWEMADDRFFWNKHLQAPFIKLAKAEPDSNLGRFILPVIYGSFDIQTSTISNQKIQFGLISRRSRYRSGTRYNTRGVDSQGNVGNFNETEQLLVVPASTTESATIFSFVQTRGSAPFHWAEIINLVFVPGLLVMDKPDSPNAFALHLDTQQSIYGEQMLVNLVKARGREKIIKEAYEKRVEEYNSEEKHLNKLGYEFFDLHTECSNNKWERIGSLIERVEPYLLKNGYFQASEDSGSEPIKLQSGVIRSNCMDCLDRTNIVQTYIAKRVLNQQLRDIGLLQPNGIVDDEPEFMGVFRNMWSDHANYVANAYTGTGALRTDYTRTGVRTRKGVFMDKFTSLVRYILNNHIDGTKQDGFDLVTGVWVSRGGPAHARALLADRRSLIKRSMKYVWAFALVMIFAGSILPRNSDYPLLYYLIIWISVFVASTSFMVKNGVDYINWPMLVPQSTYDAIHYTGPGARTGRIGQNTSAGNVIVEGEKTQLGEALKTD